ncbi:hypothetical protein HpNP120_01660 [Helicobacter pylori]
MGFYFIVLDLSCKTHFLKVLKVLKVLFYFLKGIGVDFTLDPQKKGFKKKSSNKKKGFKKRKASKEIP